MSKTPKNRIGNWKMAHFGPFWPIFQLPMRFLAKNGPFWPILAQKFSTPQIFGGKIIQNPILTPLQLGAFQNIFENFKKEILKKVKLFTSLQFDPFLNKSSTTFARTLDQTRSQLGP